MEAFSTASMLNASLTMKFNYSHDHLRETPEGCIVLNLSAEFDPWDNPHNLVSKEVTDTWRRLVSGVILPVLFLISVPCNIINAVIFFKHGIKERINLCLFFLSLVDLVHIVQAYCRYADQTYRLLTQKPSQGELSKFMFKNHLIGFFGFSWVSVWITTIIACERCFCVVNPLLSQTVLKTRTMWVIISLPSTVLLGVFFVINTKWNVVCTFHLMANLTQEDIYPSEFFLDNKDLINTLDSVIYGLIFPQFCVITVTVATIITVIKLKSLAEWRKQSSSSAAVISSRDVAVTRMLVGTSVLYIVCFIPRIGTRIAMLLVKGLSLGGRYNNTYIMLIVTATLSGYVNSSFNFPIYYVFGSKFRTTLKALFRMKTVVAMKTAGSGT